MGVDGRRRFSWIGFALLAMVLLHYFSVIGAGAVLRLAAPELMENRWVLNCVSFLPFYFIAVPAAAALLRKLPPLPQANTQPRRVKPGVFLLLLFAAYAMMIALNALGRGINEAVEQLKGSDVVNPLERYFDQGSSPWSMLPFFLIGAPLAEEFVFRALLYRHMGAFGARTYILFSAVMFAMYHTNLPQVLYAFVLGLLLAGLTYYTGDIRASVALHMALNFMGSIVPGFVLAYGSEAVQLLWSKQVVSFVTVGVCGCVILFLQRDKLHFAPAALEPPKAKVIYGNAGVIALLLVLGAMTLWTMLFA